MENIEKYSARVNTNELLAYQRDLKEEKELLQNMLIKIDKQIHGLQVEQLHLLGLMNKSLRGAEQPMSHKSVDDNQEDLTNNSLDLSVATTFKHYEEEMEDEDDI
ncbi:uncharacterized protein LOC117605657 [Osmia lignaria lignaria]|uniref:uncharacterized protein LOC114879224 n=1 Tax=Osmia bicornis bicornis TaxID=1437191 RepID=UPI0010F509DF|nr:uncharacterized protein LOC114879224 [Osmia bicornis bicornis]XP_034183107.1 uncharacterized protein LOC117605657 [Osmia lignaria]XP_034183108.1 uncharacterized protein LOC117605657 [Osmia lignaria]